jgi:ribosome-binding protein aMBF1 (putative translation factor)
MARPKDDLEEYIADRSRTDPDFPRLVDEALARRRLLRELASEREAEGLTRTVVAARMGTSESAVARLEKGEADAKLSTVGRYAAAVGKRIEWSVVDQATESRRAG